MQSTALEGGFSDTPVQSARAFRAAMNAMARPGVIEPIKGARPPAPLSPAAGTLLLTLADGDTPVHLAPGHDTPEVRDWLTFHTGAPLVDAGEEAMFALGSWAALQPVSRFAVGTPDYPDRSVTLIVECDALAQSGAVLRGPGIRESAQFSLPELAAFQNNAARFPLGWDCYFTHADQLAALPRSTKVGDV